MILFCLSPHAVSAASAAMPHACIRLDRDNNNDMDNLDRQMVTVVRHASPERPSTVEHVTCRLLTQQPNARLRSLGLAAARWFSARGCSLFSAAL